MGPRLLVGNNLGGLGILGGGGFRVGGVPPLQWVASAAASGGAAPPATGRAPAAGPDRGTTSGALAAGVAAVVDVRRP